MNESPPNPTMTPFVTPAARWLLQNREEILLSWESKLRQEFAQAQQTSRPVIIDTIPAFINNLAEALDDNHQRSIATESSSIAQEHGSERARVTPFRPDQVLREYLILREVIENVLQRKNLYDAFVQNCLQKSFDQAIQEAILAFFLVHGKVHDQFVATLGHDLRTPLAAAKFSADMLLRKTNSIGEGSDARELQSELQTLTQRILANLERTDQMIQYLLDTNALQAGENLHLQVTRGDLLELIESILSQLSGEARQQIQFEGQSAAVQCDFNLMRRAIENLINNAIKYGDKDEKIRITAEKCLGRAIVTVHNKGNPIPIQDQGRLFQSLHRADSARTSGKPGWGLGLTFVRGVCESHRGSIGIESSADKGTTFTIDFPAELE